MTNQNDDLRTEALAHLSGVLGVPEISRVIQRGRDPETARFTLAFKDGTEVRLGTIDNLWSQAKLAKILLVAIGVVPETVKASEWRTVLGGVARLCVDVEEITGEGFDDAVSEWLEAYLDTAGLDADRDGAARQGLPFRDNGTLHLTATHLAKFVRREFSEQVASQQLRQALTDLGFERQTVNYSRGKSRSTRSYYVIDAKSPSLPNGSSDE